MSACGTNIQDGTNVFLYAVFFCHLNQRFEVDVDVVFILSAGVVYENFNIVNLRKRFIIANVAFMMKVHAVEYRRFLSVYSYDFMTHLKEMFSDGSANALRCSGNQHFNILIHNCKYCGDKKTMCKDRKSFFRILSSEYLLAEIFVR